ncbi:MAG: tryptophan synthase subunit alpha [Xanthomonadales bacterium]|nr:tryptophan synthase subunit alpha [Xanthomonadales bacterium]
MSQRIAGSFQPGRTSLIPFVTAGDPHPDWTVDVMHALVEGGANLIELGVPFSDPIADGPVIQQASERAIERGVTLESVLDMVRAFRGDDPDTPVILMGYMNPIERFGATRLAEACAQAGVDGLLLVDCPPEEATELHESLSRHGLDVIYLVAPTTHEKRVELICNRAGGFIYYVSFKGITGADRLDAAALEAPVSRIRAHSGLPVAAGFGISDGASARAVSEYTDGVVIGSALVKQLAECDSREEAVVLARDFVASVRQALDNEVT